MDGTMAVVTCFAGTFAPRNWAFCNGQTLSIAQNQALFALLGTTYGGNGTTTFQLPNLQGRVPIGTGQGAGLADYSLGQVGGNSTVTLIASNLPGHVHNGNAAVSLRCDSNTGGEPLPEACYPAGITNAYSPTPQAGIAMKSPVYANQAISTAGNSQPMSVQQPYLVVNYIICLAGIFPSRN